MPVFKRLQLSHRASEAGALCRRELRKLESEGRVESTKTLLRSLDLICHFKQTVLSRGVARLALSPLLRLALLSLTLQALLLKALLLQAMGLFLRSNFRSETPRLFCRPLLSRTGFFLP